MNKLQFYILCILNSTKQYQKNLNTKMFSPNSQYYLHFMLIIDLATQIKQQNTQAILLICAIILMLIQVILQKLNTDLPFQKITHLAIINLGFLGSEDSQFRIQFSILVMAIIIFNLKDQEMVEKIWLGTCIISIAVPITSLSYDSLIMSINLFFGLLFILYQNQPQLPLGRQQSREVLLNADEEIQLKMIESNSIFIDQNLKIQDIGQNIHKLLIEGNLNQDNLLNELIVLKIDKKSQSKLHQKVKRMSLQQVIALFTTVKEQITISIIQTNLQIFDNYLIRINISTNININFEEVKYWKNFIRKKHSMMLMNNIFRSFQHEFGTQLNQIMLFSQLAIEQSQSIYTFEQIIKSCSIMQSIVSDLKDFYSISTKKFELELTIMDINEIFEEIRNIYLRSAQEKNISLQFINNYQGSYFQQDEKRIRQILLNLIQNSLKFTGNNGHIVVCAENSDINQIKFSVEDDGVGMTFQEAQKLEQILQYDYNLEERISQNTAGIGLGCYLSNKIVRRLSPPNMSEGLLFSKREEKGVKFWFKVWKYNFEPTGSQFGGIQRQQSKIQYVQKNIYLCGTIISHAPLLVVKAQSCPPKQFDVYSYSPQKILKHQNNSFKNEYIEQKSITLDKIQDCECPKILIVDDEPFNIVALSHILKQLGYSSCSANNGREAIQLIEKKNQDVCSCIFKIIIMDINMPELNGIETSRKLTQKYGSQISIICCSAFTDLETKRQAEESGMKDFLDKPIKIQKLKQILDEYL
ncbi:hypothetical protein pb186bvf_005724 [Paramecium bursaria]